MKKIIYFISVLLTCTCLSGNVRAFWPDLTPLIPFSPQFCVMCIPPAIGWAYDSINQVKDAKNRLQEMTDVTKIKQKLVSYAASLSNQVINHALQKASAKRKIASASRTIMESKREGVDIRKEESVKADFINLFLQYPSDGTKIQSVYRKKGSNIKTDMSLEMYITASEMYKELCGESGKGCDIAVKLAANPEIDISAELGTADAEKNNENNMVTKENMQRKFGRLLMITMMESCLMEGKYCGFLGMVGCASSGTDSETKETEEQPTEANSDNENEDKVCHWKSALDVAVIYDKIMRDNEYLIQLQHQYKAVMSIDSLAKIRAAQKEEQEEGGGV